MTPDMIDTHVLNTCARYRYQLLDELAKRLPDIAYGDVEASVIRLYETGLLRADIRELCLMDGVVVVVNGVRGLTRRGALLLHGAV